MCEEYSFTSKTPLSEVLHKWKSTTEVKYIGFFTIVVELSNFGQFLSFIKHRLFQFEHHMVLYSIMAVPRCFNLNVCWIKSEKTLYLKLWGSPIRVVTSCLFVVFFFPFDISLFPFVNHSVQEKFYRRKEETMLSDGEMQCSIIKRKLTLSFHRISKRALYEVRQEEKSSVLRTLLVSGTLPVQFALKIETSSMESRSRS